MIRVEGLRFTYPGNRSETLHGLEFEIERGEIFGFLGPSGSGKSTTQKILIGLLRGFTGSVTVRDRDLLSHGTEYYESIGVGFELPKSAGLFWAAVVVSLVHPMPWIVVLYRLFRRRAMAS